MEYVHRWKAQHTVESVHRWKTQHGVGQLSFQNLWLHKRILNTIRKDQTKNAFFLWIIQTKGVHQRIKLYFKGDTTSSSQ